MPALYSYRIFISHAWSYGDDYYRLEKMFTDYANFSFQNYSVPQHDPLDTGAQIAKKLTDQLNPVQVVVVLAGMYAAHSDWIKYEIDEAKRLKKPIIVVKPWGQERVPQYLQDAATEVHGWNISPIVDAIRRLA